MPDLTTRITKKALLLAKKEITLGLDPVPDSTNDAMVVEEPAFEIDPTILERNFVADDLSPFADIIGRKQATITFTTEMKGNGLQQSGLIADAPKISRLMEACGYFVNAVQATIADQVTVPVNDFDNPVGEEVITWVAAGTVTATKPVQYTMEVTTGGISGTAMMDFYSNDLVVDDTTDDVSQVITSGTPLNIGTGGATIAPTFTGSLTVNTKYYVVVFPDGIRLTPISSGQETYTIYLYLDGVRHIMTAARGNFTITAEAGNIAKVDFTFQGNYVAPTDESTPATPVFETQLPEQVELANLTWGQQRDLVSAQWTFEQGNTLTPRPDVNANEGIKGVRITARDPVGSMNPEATTEADHPFWAEIEAGKLQFFVAKVGQAVGNNCFMWMPKAQISAMPYGDRDGIRTYEVAMKCTRHLGDDEVEFYFS